MSIEDFNPEKQVLRLQGNTVVTEERGALNWLARTWLGRTLSKKFRGRDDYDIGAIAEKLAQSPGEQCIEVHLKLSTRVTEKWGEENPKTQAFLDRIAILNPALRKGGTRTLTAADLEALFEDPDQLQISEADGEFEVRDYSLARTLRDSLWQLLDRFEGSKSTKTSFEYNNQRFDISYLNRDWSRNLTITKQIPGSKEDGQTLTITLYPISAVNTAKEISGKGDWQIDGKFLAAARDSIPE